MRHTRRPVIVRTMLCLLSAATAARAADPPSDQPKPNPIVSEPGPATRGEKSGYTLFNPTPPSLLRGMNTDRPDVTEGPFTVDAGHFQTELSFVEYTYDYDRGVRSDGFSVAPMNFRAGLLNNLELDVMFNPYVNSLTRARGEPAAHLRGFGDAALRMKFNFWGNDGGDSAFGLLPFVNFPTASDGLSNHHVEGGLILPFALKLPADFDLGAMAEFDLNRNAANSGYGLDFVHTVTVGHELTEKLNAYVEYVGKAPHQLHRTYVAFFDTGVTYAVTDNVQLDAGVNIGLSRHADDLLFFTGLSFRI